MGAPGKHDIPIVLYAVEKNASSRTVRFWEVTDGRVPQWRRGSYQAYVNGRYYPIRPASEFRGFMTEATKSGYTTFSPSGAATDPRDNESLEFVVLPDPNTRRSAK